MQDRRQGLGRAMAKKLRQEKALANVEEHTNSTSLLMNPRGLEIFLSLCHSPGNSIRGLSRMLETHPPTIKRHLDKMVKTGLAQFIKFRNRKLFYLPATTTEEECRTLSLFNDDELKKLYSNMDSEPIRIKDLARDMGEKPQIIFARLKTLVEIGLVEKHNNLYRATGLEKEITEKSQNRRAKTIKNLKQILSAENLSPSEFQRKKDKLTTKITVGKERKTVTLYLSPQNLM